MAAGEFAEPPPRSKSSSRQHEGNGRERDAIDGRERTRDRDIRDKDRSRDSRAETRESDRDRDRGADVRDRDRDRDRTADKDRDRSSDRFKVQDRERERERDSRGRDRERDGRGDRRIDRDNRVREDERLSTRNGRSRSRSRERGDRNDRLGKRHRSLSKERERDSARGRDGRGADGRHDNRRNDDGRRQADDDDEDDDGRGSKASKPEPLALEDLLKLRQQQVQEESKPRFLSKKEREELAMKKREDSVAAQRVLHEEMRRAIASRQEAARAAEQKRIDDERKRYQDEREQEKEREYIQQLYLGQQRKKRKIMKASDKFRFNFDWEAGDDTSQDLNPLYANPHEAALLFGRGMRAGIDRREQRKQSVTTQEDLLQKHRDKRGEVTTANDISDRRQREEAADRYEGADMRIEKHWTDKTREGMTERDWRILNEDYNIAYKNPGVFKLSLRPYRSWDEAPLPEEIVKAIRKLGYKKPSPIQMASIPFGLAQRDVIGLAETGSGKTAAFVIPMLMYIQRQPPMTEENCAEGPYALVMAPTRELAQQIEEETVKLSQYMSYKVMSIVGGQNIEEQGMKLRRGCEIVIATPGRLIDCLERRYAVLNQCNYVVLDEADRMIDLGFEPQVVGVLDAMPSTNLKPADEDAELEEDRVYRTTYMFSATMPPTIERLARRFLRRPVTINIGSAGRVTENVTQRVIMVREQDKPSRLQQELTYVEEKKAIVFVNTRTHCDTVYRTLADCGFACTIIHGGKTQDQRELSIKGFKEGTYNALIATDVVGRGIDVPDVALVINYDMPHLIEHYTHRIGRTGRAGKKGVAITFLTMEATDVFFDLKKLLEDSGAPVPPELARHEAARIKPGGTGGEQKRHEQKIFMA